MNTVELINFTNLSLEEKKLILSWRNHPSIRKWMYTEEIISLENHLSFIETLKNTKSKQYFVVKDKENYLGVIDFCDITPSSVIMGLYKNPILKGVGILLLQSIIQYAFETLKVTTIISEVFESNVQAYKLYNQIGFKTVSEKVVNNKKVIVMQLSLDTDINI